MRKFTFVKILCILACNLLCSCQKGDDLVSPGFGTLVVNSSFTGEATPLLIQIDGKLADSLTFIRQNITSLPIQEGERHISFVNKTNNKVISDTTVVITTQNTFTLPTFLYTGTAVLFDELSSKPVLDSMLVRFVTTDPTLPTVMDIELTLTDFGSISIPLANKKILGIRKDGFSNFIQLPNPTTLLPAGTDPTYFYYVIEGFDPANGNAKVMSIIDGTYSYVLDFETFTTFTTNSVISLGIGAPQGDPSHYPSNIFRRIAR